MVRGSRMTLYNYSCKGPAVRGWSFTKICLDNVSDTSALEGPNDVLSWKT